MPAHAAAPGTSGRELSQLFSGAFAAPLQAAARPRRERSQMPSALRSEIRATLVLALPLAAANLSQIAMSAIDTVMVGRLGAVPLAAVALGGGFYFTRVVVGQGVLTAVAPLAAYHVGAGERAAAARVTASGLLLAMLLAVPIIAAMFLARGCYR